MNLRTEIRDHLEINSAPKKEYNLPFPIVFQTAFAHIGVSIGIVTVNSFLNSELRFEGWKPSLISLYLGSAILFEFSRIYAGKIFDQAKSVKIPFLVSILLITIGIAALPLTVQPIGNIWIILVLGLFFIGSSTISTLVDSVLTVLSISSNRTHIAGVLQTLRLSGFAIGGIIGAILYPRLNFTLFCIIIALICGICVSISFVRIILIENEGSFEIKVDKDHFDKSIRKLFLIIKQPKPAMMTLFLILYPLGLFMQDLILETFTIDNFEFSKEGIGRVVIIWSTLTLIFVPIGVKLEHDYISRRYLGFIGAIIGTMGIMLIGITTFEFPFRLVIFFFGLILFGIGNGLISAPLIALMLDISAEQKSYTAMLLGFFGVVLTIGRFNAAWIAGLILFLTDQNYFSVFYIEAGFLLSTCFPIYFLTKDGESSPTTMENIPIIADLN